MGRGWGAPLSESCIGSQSYTMPINYFRILVLFIINHWHTNCFFFVFDGIGRLAVLLAGVSVNNLMSSGRP